MKFLSEINGCKTTFDSENSQKEYDGLMLMMAAFSHQQLASMVLEASCMQFADIFMEISKNMDVEKGVMKISGKTALEWQEMGLLRAVIKELNRDMPFAHVMFKGLEDLIKQIEEREKDVQ